jgi:hypothetical protein
MTLMPEQVRGWKRELAIYEELISDLPNNIAEQKVN